LASSLDHEELAVKIQEVIDRAITDPIFAADLAAKAGTASREMAQLGQRLPSGDAWEELLGEFADSPEELSQLVSLGQAEEEAVTTTTSITTLTTTTTVTTLACTVTTTTTTTGTTTLTTGAVVEADVGED
jgi:hypothetical protein